MMSGLREILIISTPRDLPSYKELLGDARRWGLQLSYAEQPSPDGLAQALIIAESFLEGGPSCLILGDNIFFGHELSARLKEANSREGPGATVFAYHVNDPNRYGVVAFDKDLNALDIEEKPQLPRSNYAVTGLYYYDNRASRLAKELKPSARGELEITDLNKKYLEMGQLKVTLLGRGFAWLDTGTHETLLEAGQFIHTIENRQGMKVACPEEVAWRNGWIDDERLAELAKPLAKNNYGRYLNGLLNTNR
jgi:glucose-1-phosphate thymidylyltransferase